MILSVHSSIRRLMRRAKAVQAPTSPSAIGSTKLVRDFSVATVRISVVSQSLPVTRRRGRASCSATPLGVAMAKTLLVAFQRPRPV